MDDTALLDPVVYAWSMLKGLFNIFTKTNGVSPLLYTSCTLAYSRLWRVWVKSQSNTGSEEEKEALLIYKEIKKRWLPAPYQPV